MLFEKSESLVNIMPALVKFQSRLHGFEKNSEGYKYKFVNIDTILECIRPIANEYGLFLSQNLSEIDGRPVVNTMIFHESGEYMIFDGLSLKPKNPNSKGDGGDDNPQAVGSAITYNRRYSLTCALGINAETDDDANLASYGVEKAASKEQIDYVKRYCASTGDTWENIAKEVLKQEELKIISMTESHSKIINAYIKRVMAEKKKEQETSQGANTPNNSESKEENKEGKASQEQIDYIQKYCKATKKAKEAWTSISNKLFNNTYIATSDLTEPQAKEAVEYIRKLVAAAKKAKEEKEKESATA